MDTSLGTVRDSASGLTWSRCLYGQVAANCFGEAAAFSWVDALNKARGSALGGITNWRMPKKDELKKLYGKHATCIAQVMPGAGKAIVWSASANLDYATDAWSFDFGRGEARVNPRDSKLQLLLVASPL